MVENETDATDRFLSADARFENHEGLKGLWRRYRRLPRNVFAISLVSLLNDASSEIIYPLLPVFLSLTLGASPAVVGLIEGTAESISSLLKVFSGYFSDRRGKRKTFVVLGYALASFVRPFLAFAGNWYQVLAIRLTDRVGKGIRSAPRDAMIADAAGAHERGLAFGLHRAMDHAGAVIGPLAGYLLVLIFAADRDAPTAAEFTRIFLLASIPAIAAVVVVGFFVRESPQLLRVANRVSDSQPSLSLIGFQSNFKRFLAIIALFTLANSADAFLLLRAQTAGVPVVTIPLLWAMLHVSKVISSLFGGHLSDLLGRRRLIAAGWFLYAAVYAGFAFVTQSISVWILFLVYGIYFGLVEGAEKAFVADLVRPEQRGTAYGLYNLAFGITVLPASLLMGGLWKWWGPAVAFLASAGIAITAALLLLTLVRVAPFRRDQQLSN
jgi:MFS family permease